MPPPDDGGRPLPDAATIAPDRPGTPDSVPFVSGDWGRFTPGTLFAGRFRIVAPLGRGGMGEVYRADDLRLGQTVALKLLPEHLALDPARLAQFHNEVRVARTIAHRNVCRTYDIGDADGRLFLTMEYVDGEDLASLLRRIGRVPQDKAIELARQICAGLAAAHERGVLHRDLKPANVMIDGDGHVRLTDFGLASVAGTVDDVRAGTPAYMAPEQLAGREVTQRSDIYSLGLVLFELFTGKRVFEANTLNELLLLHESGTAASATSLVHDLDPTIDRAIQRCLERTPAKRPGSALAVAAALPGGNQLAAALAAGETPSPEMVAAAGEQSAIRPLVGLSLVAFTIGMLALLASVSQRVSVVNRIPMPKSIDSLRDRAQELIERVGYSTPPYDTVHGWSFSREYFAYVGRERPIASTAAALSTGRTGTLAFWYRTSPVSIVPSSDTTMGSANDPPLLVSDMRLVRLDPVGRLTEFHSVPPQVDEASGRASEPDWAPLFDAAGLRMSAFHDVAPRWLPRHHADRRAAWEGPFPEIPDFTARVEAAAYRGKPIFFSVIAPWTVPVRMLTPAPRTIDDVVTMLSLAVGVLVVIAAAWLARRHLRSGRGDTRGASRTAILVFVSQAAAYTIRARHHASLETEYIRMWELFAFAAVSAAGVWLLYMAFEPYVRRLWPELLIGWSRLLSGRVRDPLVGRDVLIGVAAGTVAMLLTMMTDIVPHVLNRPLPTPILPIPWTLLGTRYVIAAALFGVLRSLAQALQCVCIVVFLKLLVRRNWLVWAIGTLILIPVAMSGTIVTDRIVPALVITVLGITLILSVLMRFGVLAAAATFYTLFVLEGFTLTTDASRPYAGTSLVVMLVIAAVSAYGFYASRGDEALFGRDLLDPR